MKDGPTTHAGVLLYTIEQLDEAIERGASSGHVMTVDAIGMSRLLKALVRGDKSFDPKTAQYQQRAARFRNSPSAMLTLGMGWGLPDEKP